MARTSSPPIRRGYRSPAGALPPMRRRLAWFVGLWAAGVLILGLVSLAIKLAIGA